MKIENKIIKSGLVNWKDFEFIQSDNFKELSKESYLKLKTSIVNNNFVESFKVWEHKGKLYCLDGYHRCKVFNELLKEGYHIPEQFNADFLDCKNKKDAAKLVLIYSSIYAKISDEGFYEFMSINELDLNEIEFEIDIPDFDIELYKESYTDEFGLPDGDKEDFEQMTFTLTTMQADEIRRALKKSKEMSEFIDTGNENSNGNGIARICEVFNGQS